MNHEDCVHFMQGPNAPHIVLTDEPRRANENEYPARPSKFTTKQREQSRLGKVMFIVCGQGMQVF